MGKLDRDTGRCILCNTLTQVRCIDLYTIGSEGTVVCHGCEMEIVDLVRTLMREKGMVRRDAFEARRAEREAERKGAL